MCKRCSQYVDLHDYRITTAVAKNFKTKGAFMVELKGYVFNTESIVGDAVIKGKFHGKLAALGTLTIYSTADTAAFARASRSGRPGRICARRFRRSTAFGPAATCAANWRRCASTPRLSCVTSSGGRIRRRRASPIASTASPAGSPGSLPKRAAITKRRSPFSIPRATRIWRIGSGKTRASARWHIGRWRCGRSAKSTAPFGRWRRRRPEPPNLRTSARSLTARCTRLCSR